MNKIEPDGYEYLRPSK